MIKKKFLLVCEGPTDLYIFQALSRHFSSTELRLSFESLSPQQDATSGTYPRHGFGDVLNWCLANKQKIQMLIDFRGASALFIQMDTDIAKKANPQCVEQNNSPRQCCYEKLNERLATPEEPPRCHYVLPTQSTETWILASHTNASLLDGSLLPILNYELINNTEQRLIDLGYPSKKGKNKKSRKLNKRPADKYKEYGDRLTGNLQMARSRCDELDRFCRILELNQLPNESVQNSG